MSCSSWFWPSFYSFLGSTFFKNRILKTMDRVPNNLSITFHACSLVHLAFTACEILSFCPWLLHLCPFYQSNQPISLDTRKLGHSIIAFTYNIKYSIHYNQAVIIHTNWHMHGATKNVFKVAHAFHPSMVTHWIVHLRKTLSSSVQKMEKRLRINNGSVVDYVHRWACVVCRCDWIRVNRKE